jgi:polyisoprenoid-binding protein YceI
MTLLRSLFLAAALAGMTASAASADDYAYDKPHTTATFTATHLAFIKVHGAIPFTAGTIVLGANDLPTAAAATFDLSAIDSGDPNRDKALRTQYLETDKFPSMSFVMRKITGSPQAFEMTGDLTLHGVTKSVTLKGSMIGNATVRGKREVGYSATTQIDRRDFGITFGNAVTDAPLSVSNDIEIDIEAAALQQ